MKYNPPVLFDDLNVIYGTLLIFVVCVVLALTIPYTPNPIISSPMSGILIPFTIIYGIIVS